MKIRSTPFSCFAIAIAALASVPGVCAQAGTDATTTTYTLIAEPDQGLTPIYNLITSATKTIDMTMYELTDTTVTSDLAAAAANGVTVRVILDQNGEKSSNTTAFNFLSANGVSVHWANPIYTFTHQKTITVDQTTSAIMTLNLTPIYYSTTRDYAVITNDAADVAAIETTFNADFTNSSVTPPDGDNLVWSPTNSRTALTDLIDGATQSLMIEQEEMADTGIEQALESALSRGVAITLVQENESSDYTSILTTLANDGAAIATYSSSTGYYIHAKVVLADYGTSAAQLFVGSENFSTTSLDDNRELGLIFTDAASMTAIEADIVSDFNNGTLFSAGNASFSLSATAASVTAGGTGASTITESISNGFSSAVSLSASGLPSGVTASFNPASITGAGTSTLTLTASSSTAAGTYTITVAGTPASGAAKTATFTLTVSAAATPQFTISDSPASLSIAQGSTGTSTLTITSQNNFNSATLLTASGLPTGVTASFSPASVTPSANGSASSTLTLSVSSSASVGTATVTVTGTSGSLVNSTTLALTVNSSASGGAQTATYNSTLEAPGCSTVGTSCDSGPSLLLGRANIIGGAEPNQPNTINDSCADGTSGTFHSAESNDRIVVASTSGGLLTHGNTVTVTATVWAYDTSDALDIYYTANANNPSWVFVKTISPTTSGAQTLSTTYTLPTGSLQAVRANFRYEGSAAVCTTGKYDDHDDLIFAVQ